MPTVNASPLGGPKPQYLLATGLPAVGYQLFWYVDGSVNTKQNTYTDSTGGVANTNPIVMNALGEPTTEIWLAAGLAYKAVLAPANDTDPPTSPVWTISGLRGINDASITVDQWVNPGLTPTYVGATQFTLVGDQTSAFHVGRRVKATVSGGTSYGTITASAFGAVTTITVDTAGSIALDAGLSAVSYGLLSATNNSLPVISQWVKAAMLAGSTLSYVGMTNGTIVSSRSASAETIAVKTLAGADPSTLDPVIFVFRNATSATGDYVFLPATAALSVTVSSGSTLGATNAVPFRIWLTIFNDASTLRLGVVNCLSGTSIMALKDDDLRSSTAEGGAGGADNAQIIYTGTAVTSKAIRVIGYLDYTLAAVGTWNTAPTKTQLFGAGVPLPGMTVQQARTQTGAVATGTTAVPLDDTIPQITEGDQYLSQAITPTDAANVLRINSLLHLAQTNVNGALIAALFQDATANALAVGAIFNVQASGAPLQVDVQHEMATGTVSATTFKVRAGNNTGATTTFNGVAGGRLMGGVLCSHLTIEEIMA